MGGFLCLIHVPNDVIPPNAQKRCNLKNYLRLFQLLYFIHWNTLMLILIYKINKINCN